MPAGEQRPKGRQTKRRSDYGRDPKRERGRYGFSIPAAGRLIGLGRNAAYAAARAGQIPVIEIGGLKIVPRIPWLKKLGVETDTAE